MKKQNEFVIFLFFTLFFISIFGVSHVTATNKNDMKNKIETTLAIDIPDEFNIKENNSTFAIGEYAETFELEFDDNDFDRVETELEGKYHFEKLDHVCHLALEPDAGTIITVDLLEKENLLIFQYEKL